MIHRSCSTCVWWSDLKMPIEGVIEAVCEKSGTCTTGGDKCGQWKKLKWTSTLYDPFGSKVKDYG